VIEADMRRPSIRSVLHIPNEVGLSNVLTGSADFDSAVSRGVAIPTLDVLPSGPIPPLPSEILDSAAFDELLARARVEYDLVVIDSPPATVVTDAIPLGIRVDGVLWVIRAGTVTKPLVARASEMIAKFRLPLIGFVLNGVDIHSVDYQYSYYGYAGSNGYYDEKGS
jgi:succinoglycan biosynthesis transport protein ExoP